MVNQKTGQRELSYVVRVNEIRPIEGKDRVECAVVNGWTCMVPKDIFKPGSLGVYFEIDSLCPQTPPFAFLAQRKYKIKIQKYGNFYSQGLLMPAEDLGWETRDEVLYNPKTNTLYSVGDFLTEVLGVTYYDPDDRKRKASPPDLKRAMSQRLGKKAKRFPYSWLLKKEWGVNLLARYYKKGKDKKAFPSHLPYISKSDEERVENIPFILEDKSPWVKTVKIDGTSSLYLLERKPFGRFEYWVCSRNVRQLNADQECYHKDNVYWEVDQKYHMREILEKILKDHPKWKYAAIQGETAGISSSGEGIQGNPHKFNELKFFGYNFIESETGRWETERAADYISPFGIPWVPIVDVNYILPNSLEEFKLSADGDCEAPGASGLREGFVYRRKTFKDGEINSFKNVSRKYLCKQK